MRVSVVNFFTLKTFFRPPNRVSRDIILKPPLRPSNSLPPTRNNISHYRWEEPFSLPLILTFGITVVKAKNLFECDDFEGFKHHADCCN